jgi:hypothetical protein
VRHTKRHTVGLASLGLQRTRRFYGIKQIPEPFTETVKVIGRMNENSRGRWCNRSAIPRWNPAITGIPAAPNHARFTLRHTRSSTRTRRVYGESQVTSTKKQLQIQLEDEPERYYTGINADASPDCGSIRQIREVAGNCSQVDIAQ